MNRKASIKSIAQAMLNMLDEGAKVDLIAKTLAAYLVDERRSGDLDAVLRKLTELRAENGIYEANVSTAFAVDGLIRKMVEDLVRQNKPTARQVIVNMSQDPELVGGLKLETHDLSLDTTVNTKLKHLYQLTNKA